MTPDQPAAPGRDAWGESLERRLGLFSAVAMLVGISIGSGIFRVPAAIAATTGAPGPFLLAWVAGGFLTLTGALSLAEIAAMVPRSGGIFAYLLEGFGPLPAFLFGWAEFSVVRASALGAISTIFAEYLSYFVPMTPATVKVVAVGGVLATATLNWAGAGIASRVMNLLTAPKYVALILLGLAAFTPGAGSPTHLHPLAPNGISLTLLATALVPVMWTYDGWADISFVGGEIKDPQRTLPLALLLGSLALMVIYVLLNLGFAWVMPVQEMAGQKLVAATVAERIPLLGARGGAVVAGIVMLSALSSLNGSMFAGPRIFFAMADRGLFFRWLGRVSPGRGTPAAAIWFAAALGSLYIVFNDFAQLADKFVIGIWPFYALAVLAVMVLRRREPDRPRPYRTWGYPLVPALFLLASVGMMVNSLWTSPRDTGTTFAILLVGLPVYFGWRRLGAR